MAMVHPLEVWESMVYPLEVWESMVHPLEVWESMVYPLEVWESVCFCLNKWGNYYFQFESKLKCMMTASLVESSSFLTAVCGVSKWEGEQHGNDWETVCSPPNTTSVMLYVYQIHWHHGGSHMILWSWWFSRGGCWESATYLLWEHLWPTWCLVSGCQPWPRWCHIGTLSWHNIENICDQHDVW